MTLLCLLIKLLQIRPVLRFHARGVLSWCEVDLLEGVEAPCSLALNFFFFFFNFIYTLVRMDLVASTGSVKWLFMHAGIFVQTACLQAVAIGLCIQHCL